MAGKPIISAYFSVFLSFCTEYISESVFLFLFNLSYVGLMLPESSQLPGSHPMSFLSVCIKLYCKRIHKHIDKEIEIERRP